MSPFQEFGSYWENWSCWLLTQMGFKARLTPSFSHPGYDIKVEDCLLIDSKAARRRQHRARPRVWRGRWQFRFSPGCDLYMVICQRVAHDPDVFFIPAAAARSGLYITSARPVDYRGWAALYLWDFSQVARLVVAKRLFIEWTSQASVLSGEIDSRSPFA